MVGKVTWNRDVAIVDRLAASRLQARNQLSLSIGLRIVFIAGQQGARTERNAQNVISACAAVYGCLSEAVGWGQ